MRPLGVAVNAKKLRLGCRPHAAISRQRLLGRVSLDRVRLAAGLGRQVPRPDRAGAEHLPHARGGLARLGGVGLVDEDGVGAGGEILDLVQDEGELLERRYDDDAGGLAREGVGELRRRLVYLLDDAVGVLELVDRVLKLPVEHDPVRDDHDLVENLPVRGIVEVGEAVGEPGYGVGLAGARGVLDQVALPRPVLPGVGGEGEHGIPLVVAGEDHGPLGLRPPCPLDVHEPSKQIEPGVLLPHPLPLVGGAPRDWVGCPSRPRSPG